MRKSPRLLTAWKRLLFTPREEMWPKLPPRSGGCVWAREAEVRRRRFHREAPGVCGNVKRRFLFGASWAGKLVLIARGPRAFCTAGRSCCPGRRRVVAVLLAARIAGAATSAAKRRLCVCARSAGFAPTRQVCEIVSISRGYRSLLNGRAKLRLRSPPRCGGWGVGERAATSTAHRRLCLGARSSGFDRAHDAARNFYF